MIGPIERCLKSDEVGLYLSGGIDSALTGVFLRELGVKVHAYTSGPWGETSSDVVYAKRNAEIIGVKHHEIDYLETSDYDSTISALPQLYGIPHGNSTGLGIVKLRENTSVGIHKQIFFGQNCDSIMAASKAQYLCYFL